MNLITRQRRTTLAFCTTSLIIAKPLWSFPIAFGEKKQERTQIPPSPPSDFEFLLNKIPDSVFDRKLKATISDLSKLASNLYQRVENVDAPRDIVSNVALLRLFVNQSVETLTVAEQYQDSMVPYLPETFLPEVLHYFEYASDAYVTEPGIVKEDILEYELEDRTVSEGITIPRHVIFADHLTQSIVVSIRGTKTISDVMTDLHMDAVPFIPEEDVMAHRGMAQSANALYEPVTKTIREFKDILGGKYKNYRVVVTGHSLGAGTACLLSILLSTRAKIPVTAYAFAPPPVISKPVLSKPRKFFAELSKLSDAPCHIYSFVNDRDFIPRCTHHELLGFVSSLVAINSLPWSALERTSIVLRGVLNDKEMLQMKQVLENGRRRLQDGEDAHLFIPGTIFMLVPLKSPPPAPSPTMTENLAASKAELEGKLRSKANEVVEATTAKLVEDYTKVISSLKSKVGKFGAHIPVPAVKVPSSSAVVDAVGEEPPVIVAVAETVDEVLASSLRYKMVTIPHSDTLFNGFMFYGNTMFKDHLVTSYRAALLRVSRSGK